MEFAEELRLKKGPIRENWIEMILDSYPARSRVFFRTKKDEFLNPVGTVLLSRAEAIIESLLEGFDDAVLSTLLEDIIKIRAVQDFSPSQALAFLPLLKQALREELDTVEAARAWPREIEELEARVDQMTLLAFDIYTVCRQRIYELRIDELKRLQGSPRSRRAAKEPLDALERSPRETGRYQ
ncbi:MAG TPA: RsbRD N-terminal domain-containing protein [Acidobacteriota bacterium]|nr:RsbRD N-terminal domain-containing protein [Acidobacteriota bacterium]